jgi:hypothetical protein
MVAALAAASRTSPAVTDHLDDDAHHDDEDQHDAHATHDRDQGHADDHHP